MRYAVGSMGGILLGAMAWAAEAHAQKYVEMHILNEDVTFIARHLEYTMQVMNTCAGYQPCTCPSAQRYVITQSKRFCFLTFALAPSSNPNVPDSCTK